MAHPCYECGGECDCNGDWDDVIVSYTPKNCEGCGCSDLFNEHDNWDEDEDQDDNG